MKNIFKNFKRKTPKLTILGLENSGKSSVFHFLKYANAPILPPEPTLSFNREKIVATKTKLKPTSSLRAKSAQNFGCSTPIPVPDSEKITESVQFDIWDISGSQISIDYFWRSHIEKSSCLIFVIDGIDQKKFALVKQTLIQVVKYKESNKIPILILLNKIDLFNSYQNVSSQHIFDILNLPDICKNRMVCVQQTSVKTGYGLNNLLFRIEKLVKQSKEFKITQEIKSGSVTTASKNLFGLSGSQKTPARKTQSISYNSSFARNSKSFVSTQKPPLPPSHGSSSASSHAKKSDLFYQKSLPPHTAVIRQNSMQHKNQLNRLSMQKKTNLNTHTLIQRAKSLTSHNKTSNRGTANLVRNNLKNRKSDQFAVPMVPMEYLNSPESVQLTMMREKSASFHKNQAAKLELKNCLVNVEHREQRQSVKDQGKTSPSTTISSNPTVSSLTSTTDKLSVDSGNCSEHSQSELMKVNQKGSVKVLPPRPPIRRTKSCRYDNKKLRARHATQAI